MTVNQNLHLLPQYTTWPQRERVRAGRIEGRRAESLVVSTLPFGYSATPAQQHPHLPVEVGEDWLARVGPALGAWLVLHADGLEVMDAGAFGVRHALESDPHGKPFL